MFSSKETVFAMASNRQRIVDLHLARVPKKEINDIVGIQMSTMYKVIADYNERGTTERKPGSGGHNKKQNEEFLNNLRETIEADPTTSMRKLAKEKNISDKLICDAVKDLI